MIAFSLSSIYRKYVGFRTGFFSLACRAIVLLEIPVTLDASMILPNVFSSSCVSDEY